MLKDWNMTRIEKAAHEVSDLYDVNRRPPKIKIHNEALTREHSKAMHTGPEPAAADSGR